MVATQMTPDRSILESLNHKIWFLEFLLFRYWKRLYPTAIKRKKFHFTTTVITGRFLRFRYLVLNFSEKKGKQRKGNKHVKKDEWAIFYSRRIVFYYGTFYVFLWITRQDVNRAGYLSVVISRIKQIW